MRPLDPAHVVRGQYTGYREEQGVDPASDTGTFAARRRAGIDNWRWAEVAFHFRTGKALAAGRHVVTLGLHEPVLRMFPLDTRTTAGGRSNELVIDFGTPGPITARLLAEEPCPSMRLADAAPLLDALPPVDPYAAGSWDPAGIEARVAPCRSQASLPGPGRLPRIGGTRPYPRRIGTLPGPGRSGTWEV
ncbi:hypothetical protein ACQKM2_12840 [Streptomyces sp. NPDC004126]|uniref:hypothetical protein n=1 Tax=Streptomyces sp. NPDC004126 TaxID=3390695 RepID=UPI003D001586